MRYQIVFCDIDGTLLDSKHHISKNTGQKIRELVGSGVPFILVSARMPGAIRPIQRELGLEQPMICYSGSLILGEREDCIHSIGIGREKAVRVDAFIREGWPQICCSAYSHHDWIAHDLQDEWIVQEQQITSAAAVKGPITDVIPPDGQVHKFLCMGEPGPIESLGKLLKEEFPELTVYRSKDTYLEIMDGSASKSGAIRHLCRDYGIPVDASVSFGDSFNDIDMLLATGVSFAMGNAPDEVKKQARFVTLDNDHEGVLKGLEQLEFAKNRA